MTSGAVTSTPPPATRMDRAGWAPGPLPRSPGSGPRAAAGWILRARIASGLRGVGRGHVTSRKIDARPSAVAASTSRVSATTPPYAETGSPARAACHASRSVARSAAPQGFVCLTTTQAGPRSARPIASAPEASSTLVVGQRLALQDRAAERERTGPHSFRGDGSGRPADAGSRRSAGSRPFPSPRPASADTGRRTGQARLVPADPPRPRAIPAGSSAAMRAS